MFGRKKKVKSVSEDSGLYTPLDGEVVEISTVSDPIFAKKVMGDGFAVEPSSNKILSPVAGEVTVKQGHALGLKRADGLEVLLHLGIDTVSLNGRPFDLVVNIGDIVEPGDVIGTVDWAKVEEAELPKTTMVLITNTSDRLEKLQINYGPASAGMQIGEAIAK